MISNDEYLERIVAGIHAVTTNGADVTWNEVINRRQFDVVVRFKLGTLRYLVLVEVKNRTRKAKAEDIDAFVTKARDQRADKAVFVTAAGYQSGAIAVAKRNRLDLFTVTFDEKRAYLPGESSLMLLRAKGAPAGIPPTLSIGEPTPVANIENATLVYEDGKRIKMPSERSQMNYYVVRSVLEDGRTLDDMLQQAPRRPAKLGKSKKHVFVLNPPRYIEPPDEYFFPRGILSSVECTITGRMGYPVEGNTLIEPSSFTLPVIYTNVMTGEADRFETDQLPLGVKRVSVGNFYFNLYPLKYYYCESIKGTSVLWHLIESFQNDDLLTSTFTQDIRYSTDYIPVSDKKTLNRLQLRLEDHRRRLERTQH